MSPESFLDDFVEAFNNLETDRFVAMFDDDATVFQPIRFRERVGGSDRTASWRAIHEGFRATLPGPPYLKITPLDLQLQKFGEVVIATFHLAGTTFRPSRGESELGRRTIVLRRVGDSWKIVHLHASTMPATP